MRKLFRFVLKVIPKFDLSRTEDKLKLFILVNGLLIFVGIGSVGMLKVTSTPQFCSSCHEMRPEYVTWKATSHNQVDCVKCHIEPGLDSLVKHKISAMKQLYQHVTGQVPNPIEMPQPIESYVCEQCHSRNRLVNASGDLIIPHNRHLEQEIECVRCHKGVAHGLISEREVTREIPYDDWTVKVASNQTKPKLTRPPMGTCMGCHKERGVTRECSACHKVIRLPDSHEQDNWKVVHGQSARKGYKQCLQCHASDSYIPAMTEQPVKVVARSTDFCYSCHLQKPENHKVDNWGPTHRYVALEKGKDNCFTCHDVNQPKPDTNVTGTYCNKCHWFPDDAPEESQPLEKPQNGTGEGKHGEL